MKSNIEMFEIRRAVIFARLMGILDPEKIIQSVGPKMRFEICSCQESRMQSVNNCLVRVSTGMV